MRQTELQHFTAKIVVLVIGAPITEARAAAVHGGFDASSLDGPNKRVCPERLMRLGVIGREHVLTGPRHRADDLDGLIGHWTKMRLRRYLPLDLYLLCCPHHLPSLE